MLPEFPSQFVSALGNRSDAAPFAVADFEYLMDQVQRDSIPITLDDAGVLVLDVSSAGFKLADGHENPLKQIERLKAGDDNRHTKTRRDGFIFSITHDCADVARTQESLHTIQ